ncbi:hypothetical protein QQG55_27005 [Brugia pahangi]
MTKLVVYLAFIIFCGNQGQNVRRAAAGGVGAKIVTDYKADKLWDDDLLMETTQVQESIMTNCDTMKDGRLFILDEKPLLLITNSVNLMNL